MEEVRISAKMRFAIYKQKAAWYCNRNVNERQFQVSDFILRKAKAVNLFWRNSIWTRKDLTKWQEG